MLLKLLCRFNATPVRISTFFYRTLQTHSKIYIEEQKGNNSKEQFKKFLKNKEEEREFTLPHIKNYENVAIIVELVHITNGEREPRDRPTHI